MSESLNEFLETNDIDVRALSRIKHRLFIVGRFNQENKGTDPDLYLFTNRPDLSDRYRKNFKLVTTIEYDQFVKALRPAIAERVEHEGRFPVVRQYVPQGDDAQDSASVMDTFNFFFMRAVADPDQDVFKDVPPGLPKELLQDSEGEGGKAIFQLIRKNLHLFSEFQPRTHEIILAVSKLLDVCARQNGMPPYAEQGALPPGFPERLVDFVYAQDATAQFSLEGLDLSEQPWRELTRNEDSRRMFSNVITAFRDELLAAKVSQFNGIKFAGKTLNEQARAILPKDLITSFVKAREAYNGLRQILRSKVLLSMVLEWLLKAYYDIDAVTKLGDEADKTSRHEAIEKAILEGQGVAAPIKRPTLEEREKFSKSLSANFESLLAAVLSSDTKAIGSLPPEIRDLATEIRNNKDLVRILSGVSGADRGADYTQAFLEAAKTMLMDVMCPALFQVPILSVQMLRQYFRHETMAAYLTAVFMDEAGQDAVRKIADDHIGYFQTKIVKGKILDFEQVQQKLLKQFVDVIAKPEIARRLEEGLKVLGEAHTVLENANFQSSPGQEPGAGKISAISPDPQYKPLVKVFQRTKIRESDVTTPLEKVVDTEVKRQVSAVDRVVEKISLEEDKKATSGAASVRSPRASVPMSAAAASTMPSSDIRTLNSAKDGQKNALDSADTSSSTVEAEAPRRLSDIEKRTRRVVEKVINNAVADDPGLEFAQADLKRLVQSAHKELIEDRPFVEKVKENVRAFEQVLYLIYQRYNENQESTKKSFRNRVERLTLINMMLLFQREIGLGQVSSNLHHLLLDLVQHLDPDKPNPAAFIKEKSLTAYFDNADLENGGFTDLIATLRAQGYDNLEQTKDFVSELRGVKYLMDVISGSGNKKAEIVVVNCTATEFLSWIREENLLRTVGSRARLQSGSLVTTGGKADWLALPGLVYLTDAAFGGSLKAAQEKTQYITQLTNIDLAERELSIVLPPMCISTSYRKADEGWIDEGKSWIRLAAGVPAPLLVVGPTSFMNSPQDVFKTYLSAGYLLCAHFLGGSLQGVQNHGINDTSAGRFRVIGYGTARMDESLNRLTWGKENDTYAFAADFYLYIVLSLLATSFRRIEGGVDVQSFFKCFYYDEYDPDPYLSSAALDPALIGHAHQFAMNEYLGEGGELSSVSVARARTGSRVSPSTLNKAESSLLKVTDVGWFDVARRKAGLPPYGSVQPSGRDSVDNKTGREAAAV